MRHERHSNLHLNLRQERERRVHSPAQEERTAVGPSKPELGPVARKLSPHSPERHRRGDTTPCEHCETLPNEVYGSGRFCSLKCAGDYDTGRAAAAAQAVLAEAEAHNLEQRTPVKFRARPRDNRSPGEVAAGVAELVADVAELAVEVGLSLSPEAKMSGSGDGINGIVAASWPELELELEPGWARALVNERAGDGRSLADLARMPMEQWTPRQLPGAPPPPRHPPPPSSVEEVADLDAGRYNQAIATIEEALTASQTWQLGTEPEPEPEPDPRLEPRSAPARSAPFGCCSAPQQNGVSEQRIRASQHSDPADTNGKQS